MKKIFLTAIFGLLTLLFFGSLAASAHHSYPFPDVGTAHPYYTAIEYLRARNMIFAYSDGYFHPEDRPSRAQFVAMVVNAARQDPNVSFYNNCYIDVKLQSFADEVCYAKAHGWLYGAGSTFQPNHPVSPGDAIMIVSRAFQTTPNVPAGYYGSFIDRAEVGDLLYRTLVNNIAYTPTVYIPPAQTYQTSIIRNPYSVNVPPGYPRPYVP